MKKRFTKTETGISLEIDLAVIELLGISPDDVVEIKTNGNSLIIEKSELTIDSVPEEVGLLPPTPDLEDLLPSYVTGQLSEDLDSEENEQEHIPSSALQFQKDMDYYWQMAVENRMCEKFMGTVRPYLRCKLGYNFTEVKCEQEAKKLCLKFYKMQEKGEEFSGPYLPEV